MAIPEYVSASEIIAEEAKAKRAYKLIEQEIKGLETLIDTINDKIQELKTSFHTDSGEVTKQKIDEKMDEVEDSIRHIRANFNSMGSEPNIVKTEIIQYGEVKIEANNSIM